MKKHKKSFVAISLLLILTVSSVGFAYAISDEDIGAELKAIVSDLKVKLNGNQILDRVVVIDGKSYLPLAKISQLLGLNINFNKENRVIELSSSTINDTKSGITEIHLGLLNGNYVGNVELLYENGVVYIGGYRNGVFHGKGKITFPDGTTYNGNFINGVMEGQGEYTTLSGDVYVGQFKDNDYYGHGKYTYVNGDSIEGEFDGDNISGYACVKISGEDEEKQIKGDKWNKPIETMDMKANLLNSNKYNGTVDIVFTDGTHYVGAVTDGYFHGNGMITYQDGSSYKGNWIMGKITGQGTFIYADGNTYKGNFVNGKYDGDGKFYYANGDIYDGAWKQGKKEGYGKYIEANGNYFYGMWKDDVKHTLGEDDDEDYKGYGTYVIRKKNTRDNERVIYKQKWANGKLIRQIEDD